MVVSGALVQLANAMKDERVAKSTYEGEEWEKDGFKFLMATKTARDAFERSLSRFVDILVKTP